MTDLATVTAADFESLEARQFARVVGEGEPPVSITLTDVRSGRSREGMRDPFTLTFTGPPHLTLDQGIHPLTHPTMGLLELFLVPVARDESSMTYEAAFG
ncbi:MAG: hypothetical protein QOE24_222 [Frankiales bacterium]|nr:hypothetical protein [Frankiales bacterium]MDX6221086.1 hypothetical protein [Frankiales bacterium]